MSFSSWLIAAAAALPALAAAAEQPQADPANANAAVPAYRYQSGLRQYRPLAEEPHTPDAAWISVNHELVGQDDHTMHAMHSGETTGIAHHADSSMDAVHKHAHHHDHHTEGH